MKRSIILIIICIFIIFSCKKRRVKNKCCEGTPLHVEFTGGFIAMPNIFTPNSDGINDNLVVYSEGLKKFNLIIKKKTGVKVFKTDDVDNHWDGRYKDKAREGGFIYKLTAETLKGEEIEEKGKICSIILGMSRVMDEDFCLKNAKKCKFGNQWSGDGFNHPSPDTAPFNTCE